MISNNQKHIKNTSLWYAFWLKSKCCLKSCFDMILGSPIGSPDGSPISSLVDHSYWLMATISQYLFGESQSTQAQPPTPVHVPVVVYVPIYCPICDQWLNGPGQWRSHKLGGRHRRYKRKHRLVRKAAKGGG